MCYDRGSWPTCLQTATHVINLMRGHKLMINLLNCVCVFLKFEARPFNLKVTLPILSCSSIHNTATDIITQTHDDAHMIWTHIHTCGPIRNQSLASESPFRMLFTCMYSYSAKCRYVCINIDDLKTTSNKYHSWKGVKKKGRSPPE